MVDDTELVLYGTHGTSRSKADLIRRQGFRLGLGRHGKGVYFWASTAKKDADHSMAIELALSYASAMPHLYRTDNDSTPKSLLCEIRTNDTNFLDIEEHSTSLLFRQYVQRHRDFLQNAANGTEKSRASKVADGFVLFMEEVAKVTYDVIHTKTVVPDTLKPARNDKVSLWLGLAEAGCYIVKNLSCIPTEHITPV